MQMYPLWTAQQVRPWSHEDGSLGSQAQFAPVQGVPQSVWAVQMPGPPGVPVVPQQIRPASHGFWVPVVQPQPAPVQPTGGSSHWPPLLQKLEQQLGQASPQAQVESQTLPLLVHWLG
jgi:hypothetical protein